MSDTATAAPSNPGVIDADVSAHVAVGDDGSSAEASPPPAPAGKAEGRPEGARADGPKAAGAKAAGSGAESAKAEGSKPDAGKAAEAEAAKEAAKRKFKFKVDGKEIVEEYDEPAIQRRLQMALAAEKRIREANEQTQQARQILEAFQQDPVEAMRRVYGDEAVEKFFWNEAQRRHAQDQRYAAVPEEQRALVRELDELKAWKQQQEESAAEARQRAEAEARERETQRVREFRLNELSQAFTRAGYPAQDPYMLETLLSRAADVWGEVPDLSADQAVAAAQEMADRDTQQSLARMSDDVLERILGEKRLQSLLRRQIERIRPSAAPALRPPEPAPAPMKPTSTGETLRRAREATFGAQRPGTWRLPR